MDNPEKMSYIESMVYQFTMCFLMPEEEYIHIFNENLLEDGKSVNTKNIAKHFNVEISLAAQRGVDLGLISTW